MSLIAYLDPGTGGAIMTMIAGGLAGLALTMKMYWRRLLVFLRIRKPEQDEAPAGQTDAS